MKALIKVCVLLLVAVFLLNVPSFSDSRRFSTPQPEVELQGEKPSVTPKGDSGTPKADVKPEVKATEPEKVPYAYSELILDISCFYKEKPTKSNVWHFEIDSEGNIIPGTKVKEWSEDGRVRFELAFGKSYRIIAERCLAGPPALPPYFDEPRAEIDIINLQHSTAVSLALLD